MNKHQVNADKLIKVVIQTQCWEWYGDEDKVGVAGYGRYKAKGGGDFMTKVPASYYWSGIYDSLFKAFDKLKNVDGQYEKYEAIGLKLHREPEEVVLILEDGE